jgi:hypothetical protein
MIGETRSAVQSLTNKRVNESQGFGLVAKRKLER